MDGALVVDKPAGWTSHDVVNKIRRLAGTRRVGHLGTLDPLATGVLPVLIGRATRLARFFTRSDKVYEGVIRFGFATDTFDGDGEATSPETTPTLDFDQLDQMMDRYRGRFLQTPPPVSAKKVHGVPAYKLARKHKPVELEPVEVEMYELRLLGVEGAEARVRAHCSAGTYLRAVAHELGQELGCGAHLKALRRTASGEFLAEQARTVEVLAELAREGRLEEALIPAAQLMPDIPSQFVDEIIEGRIRQGRDFPVSPYRVPRQARYVKAVNRAGGLIAVGEMKLPNVCHPVVVL